MNTVQEIMAGDAREATDAVQRAIGVVAASEVLEVDAAVVEDKLDELLRAPGNDARDGLIEVLMDSIALHDLYSAVLEDGVLDEEEQQGLESMFWDHQQVALEAIRSLASSG